MQRIFLSYTFEPHPDHADCLKALEPQLRRVIEALELRVVDGRNLAGGGLTTEIERRISEADALIAVFTPQANAVGGIEFPHFVASEFQFAHAAGKPTFRIQHSDLGPPRGLDAGAEHMLYAQDKLLDVVMKVLQTVAIWKSERGRPVQIRIYPDELAQRFDDSRNDSCEYQLLLANQSKPSSPQPTMLFPEPGAAYVHVPNFIPGAKVRIRLNVQGDQWRSEFVEPQMGGVALSRIGGHS